MADNPLVLFPCYTVPALLTGDLIASLRGMGWEIARLSGNGAIDALRSAMASQALLTDAEWWFWLDSDVVLTPEDVCRLVESAKRHKRTHGGLMMAASYVTKQPKARHTVEWPDSEPHMYGRDGQVYPLHACGFGAVVTHRTLFERLGRELPPCAFPNEKIIGRPFFLPLLADGWYLQEDYAFCHRVRHTFAEHPVMFCDTRIRVGHVGTYEYSWDDCVAPRPTFPTYDLTVKKLGLSTKGFADVESALRLRGEHGGSG